MEIGDHVCTDTHMEFDLISEQFVILNERFLTSTKNVKNGYSLIRCTSLVDVRNCSFKCMTLGECM